MGDPEIVLRITDLHVSYGAVEAITGISLSVARGEIVTLIGANGAGKTTLLRTISGLVRPAGGSIRFRPARPPAVDRFGEVMDVVPMAVGGALAFSGGLLGRIFRRRTFPLAQESRLAQEASREGELDLGLSPAHLAVAAGLSHVPEGRLVFPDLSVRENLELGAFLRKKSEIEADLELQFQLFPRLKERESQRAGTLSGGEQQMLAIARALMSRPDVLLMDEPSLGLAPLLVRTIFETVTRINKLGTTILLVEQNAHMALSVAHRGYVLETGKIVLEGKASDLAANQDVRRAYLGE
jgi:branched-chain amino acid transport system ATP-binding protein